MLGWLEEYWSKGEAFKNGLSITLSGEEKYVIEGYFATNRGNTVNPYSGERGRWWQQGLAIYQNRPPA